MSGCGALSDPGIASVIGACRGGAADDGAEGADGVESGVSTMLMNETVLG
jgi:hypothetical protein